MAGWRVWCVGVAATTWACGGEADDLTSPHPLTAAPATWLDPATDGARTAALRVTDTELALFVDGSPKRTVPKPADLQAGPGGRLAWGPEGLRAMVGDSVVDGDGVAIAALPSDARSITSGPAGTFVLSEKGIHRLDGAGWAKVAEISPVRRSCVISSDASYVYWADPELWQILRVPVTGGKPELYAGSQRDACGVSVDDTWVSWVSVDPTLAVFVSSYTKGDLPPPDFITGAAFVGRYRPDEYGWQPAGVPGAVWLVNLHEGQLHVVDRATGEATVRRAGLSNLGGVAARDSSRALVASGADLVWFD